MLNKASINHWLLSIFIKLELIAFPFFFKKKYAIPHPKVDIKAYIKAYPYWTSLPPFIKSLIEPVSEYIHIIKIAKDLIITIKGSIIFLPKGYFS